eukprot:COSAG03_NODE_5479_length_1241_cov_2.201401_2_plen_183_part_00
MVCGGAYLGTSRALASIRTHIRIFCTVPAQATDDPLDRRPLFYRICIRLSRCSTRQCRFQLTAALALALQVSRHCAPGSILRRLSCLLLRSRRVSSSHFPTTGLCRTRIRAGTLRWKLGGLFSISAVSPSPSPCRSRSTRSHAAGGTRRIPAARPRLPSWLCRSMGMDSGSRFVSSDARPWR